MNRLRVPKKKPWIGTWRRKAQTGKRKERKFFLPRNRKKGKSRGQRS